jgi:hypothetical protein
MAKEKTYSEKLRDPRWQKKRLLVLERDGWKCTACGDDKTELHVDHTEYHGEPWEAPDECLQTLCKFCHKMIGDWRSVMKDAEQQSIKSLTRTFDNIDDEVLFAIKFVNGSHAFIEFKGGDYNVILFKPNSQFLKRSIELFQNG